MSTESETTSLIKKLRELVQVKEDEESGDDFSKTKWALAMQKKIDLCLRVPYDTKLFSNLSGSNRLNTILTWPEYYAKNKDRLPRVQALDAVNPDPVLNSKVSLWQGDITTLDIDCIVNSVNELITGIKASVDTAINKAAGPALAEALRALGWRRKGEALITKGFKLPAKYIIHIARPRGKKVTELRRCYQKSLEMMVQKNLRSIAFPSISTGFFGLSFEENVKLAVETVRTFLTNNCSKVDRIIFCTFADEDTKLYWRTLCAYFPVEKSVNNADPTKWVALRRVVTWPLYYQSNKSFFRGVDYIPDDGRLPVNGQINERVSLWQGDITLLKIDCIVKYEEPDPASRVIGKVEFTALCSPVKGLIRTWLPVNGDPVALITCLWNCLELMTANKFRTIAFPCICSKSVGFCPEEALPVAVGVVRTFLKYNVSEVDRVVFCTISDADTELYQDVMKAYFPVE